MKQPSAKDRIKELELLIEIERKEYTIVLKNQDKQHVQELKDQKAKIIKYKQKVSNAIYGFRHLDNNAEVRDWIDKCNEELK